MCYLPRSRGLFSFLPGRSVVSETRIRVRSLHYPGTPFCHLLTVYGIATLDVDLKANSGAGYRPIYSASKFVQLLGAFYWRRELPSCTVVAVSPGLIPSTPLASSMGLTMDMPDAKTIPEGEDHS